MVETFIRQELLDREMAPVVDYCCKCGKEIYDTNEAHYDALMAEWTCDDCYYELYDSEPYDDEEDDDESA